MKLLRSVGLPEHFDGIDSYSVEVEEEPNFVYEAFVFTTKLELGVALCQLESLLGDHYGPSQRTHSATTSGVASSVLTCAIGSQTVTAQITEFGDHRGGYIQSKAGWTWSIT